MSKREAIENNAKLFMENGPGLNYLYKTWIKAKDTKDGYVLLGGLGGMGVGEMWSKTEDRHKENPAYADAPEVSSVGGFGRRD